MKIIKYSTDSVKKITTVLNSGGLAIFLSGVCYNAGVDATNPKAVEKLIKYKNRPFGKPFSIGTTNLQMAKKYASMNNVAIDLYKKLYPGPITLISKGKHKVAPGIESELGTIGLFITDHKLTLDIVKKLGRPITTSSANASYKPRPFSLDSLFKNLTKKQISLIDLAVDSGSVPEKEASTVIDTTIEDLPILRQGVIKLRDKNEVLSRGEENTQNIAKELWQKYQNYTGKRAIVYALEGQMGAGKTQFTKGLAKAMGITELVTSPTFSLENEYTTTKPLNRDALNLYHFDAWRMENSEEMKALGFENLIKNKSVISVEWAERVVDAIREHDEEAIIVWVKILYGKKDNERLISWGNL